MTNNQNNQNNQTQVTKVIIPCRISFANIWEPKSVNGSEEKYSVSCIIPKSDKKTIAKIKAAVEAAKEQGKSKKWGGKIPANIKLPLRDGDIDRPDDEAYADAMFVNANSKDLLYFLLHDEPNPEMTSFVFRETLMTHLLLWGNAYAQIIRNGKGEVLALYPLMPDRMNVDRDENGNIVYEYMVSQEDAPINKGSTVKLQPSEVLHIPGLGFDGLVGYSPIAMAKNAIGLAIATEEYGSKFFANGATPSGILEFPGTVKEPERVRESWNKGFGGENKHKVAILEEGVHYSPISISPNEAQFLETRKFQIDEIARIFRIPPHMIGDLEKSSFSNIEQQSLEFVKYTLDPWVVRWEQSIKRTLLLPEEKGTYFAKFNVDGLLRGDYQSRMNGYATARQNGWMSANDIRSLEQQDLIPDEEGGNLYLVNGNMLPLKQAGSFYNNGGETNNG